MILYLYILRVIAYNKLINRSFKKANSKVESYLLYKVYI
jgi:hypothetical protein